MADKPDRNLLEVLEALCLEYLAMRHVIQHNGPGNWAKLLSDYRGLPANKSEVFRLFDGVRDDLQATPSDAKAKALTQVLWGILPESYKIRSNLGK